MSKMNLSQETFLQRILGRNYKWWFLLQFQFKSRRISIVNNLFFIFGQFLILSGTLITWWLTSGKIIDFNLQQKWTYFIVGEFFLNVIFNFGEFGVFDILRGKHVVNLMRPQNYFILKFFENYGASSLQNLIKGIILFLLFLVFFLTGNISYFNIINFLEFLIFIPIGLFLFYLMSLIVSFSAFFMNQVDGIILNFTFLQGILMGRIFPLDLLISNFWINLANPFAFTFYHPMQIYLGKYSPIQILYVFLGGISWCFFLYFLVKLVFKLGLKKNESVGL